MYRAVCVVGVSTMTLLLSACLQQQTTMGTAESPAQAAVEITQSKKPIYTTNLKISRAEIKSYVDQVVLLKEHASLPFSKWVPAKGKYIYFGLYGLSPEQAVVFGTIVAEFAHRTKLPVRPYKKGVQISWLFSYLPDLGALERMPQLKRIYCHRDARGCPDPSSPFYIAKGYSMENGRVDSRHLQICRQAGPVAFGQCSGRTIRARRHACVHSRHLDPVSRAGVRRRIQDRTGCRQRPRLQLARAHNGSALSACTIRPKHQTGNCT